jgi:hypothetical protein
MLTMIVDSDHHDPESTPEFSSFALTLDTH